MPGLLLVVSAAGRGRVLIKEPLHTGLMQPDSLIFFSTEISGCVTGRVHVAPKRPRELRETSFQTFNLSRQRTAAAAVDPDALVPSFGATDAAASSGMGLSTHCAASQRRLPGSLPLYTAPSLSLASSLRLSYICSRSFHLSHAHFLLPVAPPRQRSTGRRGSFQPQNKQL